MKEWQKHELKSKYNDRKRKIAKNEKLNAKDNQQSDPWARSLSVIPGKKLNAKYMPHEANFQWAHMTRRRRFLSREPTCNSELLESAERLLHQRIRSFYNNVSQHHYIGIICYK